MLQIKVNVINELKKIRKGVTYSSITTVLDEIIQNSQRAKATELEINVEELRISIKDNGIGCKDLSKVFEKSSSGWGLDEAFGEGFFSAFIADKIIVKSFDKMVVIDVLDVIENENLHFDIVPSDEYIDGFKTILEGKKIAENIFTLKGHLLEIGKVLPFKVTLNGKVLPKEKLTALKDGESGEFTIEVNNEIYEGTLTVDSSWRGIETFYEYRKVNNIWKGGAFGKIQFKQNAVTLKAPDRKDIVFDEKRKKFEEQLEKDIKMLYKKFVQNADDKAINKYAEYIDRILEVDEYIPYLTLSNDLTDLSKHMNTEELEEVKKSAVTEEEIKQLEALLEKVKPTRQEESVVSTSRALTTKEKKEVESITKLGKQKNKMVWVKASEVNSLKEKIAEIEYYGFEVIVAKNVLYEKAFNRLGIKHISEFEKEIETEFKLDRVDLITKKEQRVMWLLEKIERNWHIPDTFRIADIEMRVIVKTMGKVVKKEKKSVEGLTKDGKIYLDRRSLKLSKYRVDKWDSPNLTLHDLRFLLRNCDTIAHELAHLLYGTSDNTINHYQAQAKISRELADIFS